MAQISDCGMVVGLAFSLMSLMGEQAETKSEVKKASFWPSVMWPAAILVIYVLSVGPLVALAEKGVTSGKAERFLETVHTPLVVACDIPAIRKVLVAYVDLWRKVLEKK